MKNMYTLFILLLPSLAISQSFITGRVVDVSQNPIPYSSVFLVGSIDDNNLEGVSSDEEGLFKIETYREGKVKIKILSIGFEEYKSGEIILNDNELNEKNLSSLFSENFSISLTGNPNLTFQNISDFTKSWNAIRNKTYSFICSPEKFSELKFAKISIQPLIDNSVMLALLNVFYCSADHIPQYKMCFIYTLLFDENEEI